MFKLKALDIILTIINNANRNIENNIRGYNEFNILTD